MQALEEHGALVRALARRLLRDEEGVDDVVQETWLARLTHSPAARSERGWLARVVRNAVLQRRREEHRRRAREELVARDDRRPSTLDDVERRRIVRHLLEAVMSLPEPYVTAVLLRYYEELPPREIARRLGAPVATVKKRLQRAIELLRARLDARSPRASWRLALLPLGRWPALGAGRASSVAGACAAIVGVALLGGWWLVRATVGGAASGLPAPRPPADLVTTAPAARRAGAPAPAPAEATSPGASEERFEARRELRVQVIDEWGRAVPDATIGVYRAPRFRAVEEREQLSSFRAGDSGAAVAALPDGELELYARKEGVGTSGVVPVRWPHPRVKLVVLRPVIKVVGRVVTGDGRPAAGATIRFGHRSGVALGDSSQSSLPGPITADDDGRFALMVDAQAGLGAHARWGSRRSDEATIAPFAASPAAITLRLTGHFSVSGTLRDESGRPVEGAPVWLRAADVGRDAAAGGPPYQSICRSDVLGRFRLDACRPGRHLVWMPSGPRVTDHVVVALSEQEPRGSCSLQVERAAEITGRLLTPEGRPLRDMTIRARPLEPAADDPLRGFGDWRSVFGGAGAVTDEDGGFRLDGLHPDGRFSLMLVPDPHRRSLVVRSGGITPGGEPVTLVFDPDSAAASLAGRAFSSAPEDAVTSFVATLLVERPEVGWRCVVRREFDDPAGRFRIEGLVPQRSYRLVLEAENGGWAREDLVLGPGLTTRSVVLRRRGRLEIRTVDDSGHPAPWAGVHLRRVDGVPVGAILAPRRADGDGQVVAALPPGRYRVWQQVRRWRGEQVVVDVAPSSTTAVRLVVRR